MNDIEVNEEMTRLAIMAHDVAKLKQDEPEVYEAMMREITNDALRSLESDMKGKDKLTAMLYRGAIEAMLNQIHDDPFAMVEIEQMVQEIDHKKTGNEES